MNRYKVVFEWLCSAALSASDTLYLALRGDGTADRHGGLVRGGFRVRPQRRPNAAGNSGRLTER